MGGRKKTNNDDDTSKEGDNEDDSMEEDTDNDDENDSMEEDTDDEDEDDSMEESTDDEDEDDSMYEDTDGDDDGTMEEDTDGDDDGTMKEDTDGDDDTDDDDASTSNKSAATSDSDDKDDVSCQSRRSRGMFALQRLRDRDGRLPIVLQNDRRISIGGGKNSTVNSSDNQIKSNIDKKINRTSRSTIVPNIISPENKTKKGVNLDDDEKKNKDTNMLLNYADTLQFMTESMCCRFCKSNIDETSFRRTSCGLATSIFFKCPKCNNENDILPKKCQNRQTSGDWIEDDIDDPTSLPSTNASKDYSAYDDGQTLKSEVNA